MDGLILLHEDPRFLAVDKPAGLLSVPGRGPEKADCVRSRLQQRFPEALTVHRLDQATSGVLLFARDARTQAALGKMFEKREVEKVYRGVVRSWSRTDEGRITLRQRLDPEDRPRQIVDHEHGRLSVTDWRVLDRKPDRVLLELRPRTGRTHQLRLQAAASGHPLLGDGLYGSAETAGAAPRLMLHAAVLTFRHPATGRAVRIESPCPF